MRHQIDPQNGCARPNVGPRASVVTGREIVFNP